MILGKAFPRLKTHALAAHQCDEVPARRLGKSRLDHDERAELFLRQFEVARDFRRRRHRKSGSLEALDLFDLRYRRTGIDLAAHGAECQQIAGREDKCRTLPGAAARQR